MKSALFEMLAVLMIILLPKTIYAQTKNGDDLSQIENNTTYNVKNAFEVESLVPMFITGGCHFAVCYRIDDFRFRVSVINGGKYDTEPAGLNNSKNEFKRYYKTSPGFFAGYNVWKGLELYSYIEFHTFEIEHKKSGLKKDLKSIDYGAGISYQYFFGKYFYIQPGLHLYLRKDQKIDINKIEYKIPNADFAPVFRIGVRLWDR